MAANVKETAEKIVKEIPIDEVMEALIKFLKRNFT